MIPAHNIKLSRTLNILRHIRFPTNCGIFIWIYNIYSKYYISIFSEYVKIKLLLNILYSNYMSFNSPLCFTHIFSPSRFTKQPPFPNKSPAEFNLKKWIKTFELFFQTPVELRSNLFYDVIWVNWMDKKKRIHKLTTYFTYELLGKFQLRNVTQFVHFLSYYHLWNNI